MSTIEITIGLLDLSIMELPRATGAESLIVVVEVIETTQILTLITSVARREGSHTGMEAITTNGTMQKTSMLGTVGKSKT